MLICRCLALYNWCAITGEVWIEVFSVDPEDIGFVGHGEILLILTLEIRLPIIIPSPFRGGTEGEVSGKLDCVWYNESARQWRDPRWFQTPEGWDSIWTGVTNYAEEPPGMGLPRW